MPQLHFESAESNIKKINWRTISRPQEKNETFFEGSGINEIIRPLYLLELKFSKIHLTMNRSITIRSKSAKNFLYVSWYWQNTQRLKLKKNAGEEGL